MRALAGDHEDLAKKKALARRSVRALLTELCGNSQRLPLPLAPAIPAQRASLTSQTTSLTLAPRKPHREGPRIHYSNYYVRLSRYTVQCSNWFTSQAIIAFGGAQDRGRSDQDEKRQSECLCSWMSFVMSSVSVMAPSSLSFSRCRMTFRLAAA